MRIRLWLWRSQEPPGGYERESYIYIGVSDHFYEPYMYTNMFITIINPANVTVVKYNQIRLIQYKTLNFFQ